ncbi:MAG: HNH endonuclease [Moraxellaceae bacterium]
MAYKVNLDALIPREDFSVQDLNEPSAHPDTMQVRNLEPTDFFYNVLRKPDFQRETSEWTPQKICDFIKSFIDGDLIPALILWRPGGQIFAIDGAHRLSAIIAWVHDDYGDGKTSRNFFDSVIPEDQVAAAEYTRNLVKKSIKSYSDYLFAIQNPEKSDAELLSRAKSLASSAMKLQWVRGDAKKAEDSFFKINQSASPINKTEMKLLKSRACPNAMAARAIIHSGTGHKYWSGFEKEKQTEISEISKVINDLLFTPNLKAPIKTLDLPVAGKGYSAQTLPLVFDFVNLVNDKKYDENAPADKTGEETLNYLKSCRKMASRISGTHPSSLGLHPIVYFYSASGRYQQTAFLAVIELIKYLDRNDLFKSFTAIRKNFEDFLLSHKILINQVTVKYGSGAKGYARLCELFIFLMNKLIENKTEDEIIKSLQETPEFSFLQPAEVVVLEAGKTFSEEAKSAVFLRDALKDPMRCAICNGLIHKNAITIDHIKRKAEGGVGSSDNGQLAHPYCNTTLKN